MTLMTRLYIFTAVTLISIGITGFIFYLLKSNRPASQKPHLWLLYVMSFLTTLMIICSVALGIRIVNMNHRYVAAYDRYYKHISDVDDTLDLPSRDERVTKNGSGYWSKYFRHHYRLATAALIDMRDNNTGFYENHTTDRIDTTFSEDVVCYQRTTKAYNNLCKYGNVHGKDYE